MSQQHQRVPTKALIIFGLLNLPLSMLMSPTAAILPNYYLEYSSVTLAGLATATLVARLFDGLTDPLIGFLSDRAGNRKPWMIGGALLVAVSAWFLYNPDEQAGLSHFLVWYLIVTLGWTLIEIPHTAMAAEFVGRLPGSLAHHVLAPDTRLLRWLAVYGIALAAGWRINSFHARRHAQLVHIHRGQSAAVCRIDVLANS